MEDFIKYKRFTPEFKAGYSQEDVQVFLDGLITEGWKVINYRENVTDGKLTINAFCGKAKMIL